MDKTYALKEIKPKKALNKAFLKVKPNRTEIEGFKAHLITLLDRTNDTESEEFHKNLISDFLNPHCSSTRWNACIHKAVGLSEFLFVYYRFYFGEGSLLDAKGVKQLL